MVMSVEKKNKIQGQVWHTGSQQPRARWHVIPPASLLSSITIFRAFTLSLHLSVEHLSTSAETIASWSASMVGVGRRFIHNPFFESLYLFQFQHTWLCLYCLYQGNWEHDIGWTERSYIFILFYRMLHFAGFNNLFKKIKLWKTILHCYFYFIN